LSPLRDDSFQLSAMSLQFVVFMCCLYFASRSNGFFSSSIY
jgi:hypothetical protein